MKCCVLYCISYWLGGWGCPQREVPLVGGGGATHNVKCHWLGGGAAHNVKCHWLEGGAAHIVKCYWLGGGAAHNMVPMQLSHSGVIRGNSL